LKEIGDYLKNSREEKGISIEEASEDLKLDVVVLEQIEAGNKAVFNDIYELKSCVKSYSKYLCLDTDKIIDEFNEFMFEYTSKIPLGEIENAEKDITPKDKKVCSPYTMEESLKRNLNRKKIIVISIISIILISALLLMIL